MTVEECTYHRHNKPTFGCMFCWRTLLSDIDDARLMAAVVEAARGLNEALSQLGVNTTLGGLGLRLHRSLAALDATRSGK